MIHTVPRPLHRYPPLLCSKRQLMLLNYLGPIASPPEARTSCHSADALLEKFVVVVLDLFLLDVDIVPVWTNNVVQSKVIESRSHISGGSIGTGSDNGRLRGPTSCHIS
jgi:hypothetical protein